MRAKKDPDAEFEFDDKLIAFLGCGRTVNEVAVKFGRSEDEVRKIMQNPPGGFCLKRHENINGEEAFLLLPVLAEIKPKERIWQFSRQGEEQPYLVVDFPDDLKWKKINIVPIGDAYYGDRQHDERRFDDYIDWISQSPNVFAFFNGDIFRVFNCSETERDLLVVKMLELRAKLSSIAHKILWAQAGDNEEKNLKKHGLDPLRFICEEFGIPYFYEPVYVDIYWKTRRKDPFTFFCIHGRSNAQTRGGQINAILHSRSFQEFVMFTVMGHIKNKRINLVKRLCRNLRDFRLEDKNEYLIICPSFLKYFGSEAAKKGHRPFSWGSVSCRLYADGRYWTSN